MYSDRWLKSPMALYKVQDNYVCIKKRWQWVTEIAREGKGDQKKGKSVRNIFRK